jgi:hypothetical protein
VFFEELFGGWALIGIEQVEGFAKCVADVGVALVAAAGG